MRRRRRKPHGLFTHVEIAEPRIVLDAAPLDIAPDADMDAGESSDSDIGMTPQGETESAPPVPGEEVAVQREVVIPRPGLGQRKMMAAISPGGRDSEGALLRPGQKVKIGVRVYDTDEVKVIGDNTYKVAPDAGDFTADISLRNAKFADGTTELKNVKFTATAVGRDVFVSAGQPEITVNAGWNGATPVEIRVTVKDSGKYELDPSEVLAPGSVVTDVRDAGVTKVAKYDIRPAGLQNPTTMAAERQTHPNPVPGRPDLVRLVSSAQRYESTMVEYKFGADLNGANPAANYAGIVVNEVFTPIRTDLRLADLKPDEVARIRNALGKPNATVHEIVDHALGRAASGSFVINNQDKIKDTISLIGDLHKLANLVTNEFDGIARILFRQRFLIDGNQIGTTKLISTGGLIRNGQLVPGQHAQIVNQQ